MTGGSMNVSLRASTTNQSSCHSWIFMFCVSSLASSQSLYCLCYMTFVQRLIGVNLNIIIHCSIRTIIDVTGQRHRSLSSQRNLMEQSTSTLACRIPSNVKLLVDHSRSLSGERTALSWNTSILQSNDIFIWLSTKILTGVVRISSEQSNCVLLTAVISIA